ncbi:glutathione S-transferase family protein [Ascidiaceihabitans sp.]|uniref:glutathione S-transferase family protein n=1 Tax=Ascidiaceihabitans sp. TaxID=1872644 RepID=UPI0032994900
MKLYFAPNTIAVAVAVTLEEAGQSYDLIPVDFANGAQSSPAYLGVNSKGRVPALVVGDTVLTETGALLDYIAALNPKANLVPSDPMDAAKMRSVMYYLASTAHINHAHKMRGHRWADTEASFADMKAKVPETMTATAQYLEAECLAGPFVLGAHISIADFYLYTVSRWLEGDGVNMADFPRITAFLSMMERRDSIQAVRAAGVIT